MATKSTEAMQKQSQDQKQSSSVSPGAAAESVVAELQSGSVTSCVDDAPVAVRSAELDAASVAASTGGLQRESDATLPGCEAAPAAIPTTDERCRALVLSFLDYPDAGALQRATVSDRRFSVTFRHVNSIQKYRQELDAFVGDCKAKRAAERLIVHVITVDDTGQPVIGGKAVSVSQLFDPLNSCTDDQPIRTRVYHLTWQLSRNPEVKVGDASPDVPDFCSENEDDDFPLVMPRRASLCGTEVHRIDIPAGANLIRVHEGLGQAFNAMEATEAETVGEDLARRLESCCDTLKLRRMQTSGIPDASASSRSPLIPTIPDVPEEASSGFQQPLSKSPTECSHGPRNICVGFIVEKYDQCDEDSRQGSDKDVKHITETAQHLQCHQDDTHLLRGHDGFVSKENVLEHIQQIQKKCAGSPRSDSIVFVFVSAHGSSQGFKTSSGDVIEVREVVQPFLAVCGFVVLFYQPCRGKCHHPAKSSTQKPLIHGISFHHPDKVGCCLPLCLPCCAAVFAGMSGFVSYRTSDEGSLMLKALRDVVVTSHRRWIRMKELAEMVQMRLHEMRPMGLVCTGSALLQIQYTVNGSSLDALSIEIGIP